MLANFHTHTIFCDGNDTPEEMVLAAIEKGFSALGFSGHAYTDFDTSYCIKDMDGYISAVNKLKEKYKEKIEILLGVEEDAFCPSDRNKYDYIIGSCHYVKIDKKYYPVDSSHKQLKEPLKLLNDDPVLFAHNYYSNFCDYIEKRKPDIIGHFDLITKYDEKEMPIFLNNTAYNKVAEDYIKKATTSNCIFEVNTGAIARGYRSMPYPSENLLYILRKENAKIIISSDCHDKNKLDWHFEETKLKLKDIGFKEMMTIQNGEFTAVKI